MDSEDEEADSVYEQPTSHDKYLILIDASKSMLSQVDDGTSCFSVAVKYASSAIRHNIFASSGQRIGVVFFGTTKIKNSTNAKHVYVLREVCVPDVSLVKRLQDIIHHPDEFSSDTGHADSLNMASALHVCASCFAESSGSNVSRKVIIFTNNDDPSTYCDTDLAEKKASELRARGIAFGLYGVCDSFDLSPSSFYGKLLQKDQCVVGLDNFRGLTNKVKMKEHRQQPYCKLRLTLADDIEISVKVYVLAIKTRVPTACKLDSTTGEELDVTSNTFDDVTLEILQPEDLNKCLEYGGRRIYFENEEVDAVKTFGPAGIKLCGFRAASWLSRSLHLLPSRFIYPDEKSISGSATLFTALLDRCLAREKIAICSYIARASALPRLVALVPQREEKDEGGAMVVVPNGFHVVILPYADEFRPVPPVDNKRAMPSQVQAAKNVVQSLSSTYSPDLFENPSLQTHYTTLETAALNQEPDEPFLDYTLPNQSEMLSMSREKIRVFKNVVYQHGYRTPCDRSAAKRKHPGDDIDVAAHARSGRLSGLTVASLTTYITENDIVAPSGRKADLIAAIEQHLQLNS